MKTKIILSLASIGALVMTESGLATMATPAEADPYKFAVKGGQVLLNDTAFLTDGHLGAVGRPVLRGPQVP
jgi:hypothetical protein